MTRGDLLVDIIIALWFGGVIVASNYIYDSIEDPVPIILLIIGLIGILIILLGIITLLSLKLDKFRKWGEKKIWRR